MTAWMEVLAVIGLAIAAVFGVLYMWYMRKLRRATTRADDLKWRGVRRASYLMGLLGVAMVFVAVIGLMGLHWSATVGAAVVALLVWLMLARTSPK